MRQVKSVRFAYLATAETREILLTFRMMVNHAIRIGLDENIRGRFNLRNRIYREFRERYGVLSFYPYSVAEVAWSILKKHRRWHRRSFASKLMMKLDSGSYSFNEGVLTIPNRKGRRVSIPLRYGRYQQSFLNDKTLKRCSVTMTESAVFLAFSKEMAPNIPVRKIGYDLNHKSIVGSDGTRIDLSEVARLNTASGVRNSIRGMLTIDA